ncbi:MAG: hypothetical protein Q8P49_04695 [Candidatus Liptonbacteria bacterium]|nr:hypothetical protein [Candidatus Liptonbacteria bacterium]
MYPEKGDRIESKMDGPGRNRGESGGAPVSRREFLKQLGIGSAILGLGMYGGFEEADAKELKGMLEDSLHEEAEAGHPAVRVEFVYAPHRTARDMQKLRERITEADIVIPEDIWWDQEGLKVLRDLSAGNITPEQALRQLKISVEGEGGRKWLETYEIIYNSHKDIEFIDVPDGHPLGRKIIDYFNTSALSYDGDFPGTLELVKDRTRNLVDIQKEREAYMLARLKEVIKKHAVPDKQRALNILISLGIAHTDMWHKLKSEGVDARAAFASMPFIFDNEGELFRRYLFGKNVDNELVARAIQERMFFRQFRWPPTEDSGKAALFFRKVTSLFAANEIKEIFEAFKDKSFSERSKILTDKLAAKHVRWPESEKEIDDFLGPKTAPE